MGKITAIFGGLLIALGVAAFWWAGPAAENITALAIPGGVGLVLLILGLAADSAPERRRMHLMHAAVLLGLLGFLVPAGMAGPKLPTLVSTGHYLRPSDGKDKTTAVVVQTAMAAICGIFVALCVNSFIQARRRRRAEATSIN